MSGPASRSLSMPGLYQITAPGREERRSPGWVIMGPVPYGIRREDQGTHQGHSQRKGGHLWANRRSGREPPRSAAGRARPPFLFGNGRASVASRHQQPRRDIASSRARLRGTTTAPYRRRRQGRARRAHRPRRIPMAIGRGPIQGRQRIPESARVTRSSSPTQDSGTSLLKTRIFPSEENPLRFGAALSPSCGRGTVPAPPLDGFLRDIPSVLRTAILRLNRLAWT